VQEAADLTMKAFDVADKYLNPVMVLGDAILGQMMEPLVFKPFEVKPPPKPWAVGGKRNGRPPNLVNSLSLEEGVVEDWNWGFKKKYDDMRMNEIMVETLNTENADLILVAYGTSARICKSVMNVAREKGLKVGMIRPVTLWPFPYAVLARAAEKTKEFLVVEMSLGQMIEDVKLSVLDRAAIHFHGRPGGGIPLEKDVMEIVEHVLVRKRKGAMATRGTFIDWKIS
jgi:2-oxoglutarate ferredoxin oxidoreductase subunit alpha